METFYPDIKFEDLNEKSIETNNGSFDIGKSENSENFNFVLDINFPKNKTVNNETELLIGRTISQNYNMKVLVAGDFYDGARFPHSWIIINSNEFFEAVEQTNSDGKSWFEIIEKIEITLHNTGL